MKTLFGDRRHHLQTQVESLGWFPRHFSFWEYYDTYHPKLAIVAPPLDSIPSKNGNAIYTLIERIAFHFPEPIIILARGNEDARKLSSLVDEKILYSYQGKNDSFLSSHLPYRIKKYLWGSSAENIKHYFSMAGKASSALGIDSAILEDEALGVLSFKQTAPKIRVVLHQHQPTALGLSFENWKRLTELLEALICVSRKTINQIEEQFGPVPVPSRVIYNGVDLDHYDPLCWVKDALDLRKRLNLSEKTRIILYVGRVLPQKGVLEAIKAFQYSNLQDTCFVIIGDMGVDTKTVSTALSVYIQAIKTIEEKLPGKVIFAGVIPQERLPVWYEIADVLLVPSLGDEGLPKVITEAFAMGCSVVATDRGGNWELIRDQENGWYLHNPENMEEFGNLLVKIFSDNEKLSLIKEKILSVDRPKMDEKRMVSEFVDLLYYLRQSETRK
jgi:glycosyltransferase involved in cell wall biosynthesis